MCRHITSTSIWRSCPSRRSASSTLRRAAFLFRSPPDFPLICSFPRAGPSRSDTYAHPSQGRLPIECIHLSTRTGSCKELSHSASFLPPFWAAPAHFYACSSVCRELLVEFVRFSKNAIFRTFIGEKSKKGLVILPKKWYVVSNKGITLDT